MAETQTATPSVTSVAQARAQREARDAAVQFISASRLEHTYSPETAESAIELLVSMLMVKWHEGAIAGIDAALARVNA